MLEDNEQQTDEEHSEPDSGAPKGRARSKIAFPYLHLGGCLEIVDAVHEIGGDACRWNQLAARMGQAPQGGTFRQKMLAARVFGLLDYTGQEVALTDIGRYAHDPDRTKFGRIEAFLNVSLFAKMFERLDGSPLPQNPAIEQQMESYGVPPKQTAKARQVFIRSARDSGFFDINPSRLTRPSVPVPDMDKDDPDSKKDDDDKKQDDDSRHRLIEALLAEMPTPGEKWDQTRCLIWLQTLLSSLSIIYANFDELRGIEIRLRHPNGHDAA